VIAGYSASRQLMWRCAGFAMLTALALWSAQRCEVKLDGLLDGAMRVGEILTGFFPPDWSAWRELLPEAGSTVLLAATATLVGFLLSVPIGLAGASNISPTWLRLPVRLLLGLERATPEVIILLFFVVAFGLGAFAGIVTLGLSSVAMLGKLVADAVEETDPGIWESVEATGGSRWQVIRYGIIPQVIPSLVSQTLFRFDYNMRNTVVLGAVGAGGLGQDILMSIARLRYERATLAALFSLALILAAEQLSSRARRRWLGDAAR
jgi:phosphonate transport system permease protein